MRLNLKDIILMSGKRLGFDLLLDLTQLDFNGYYPVAGPAHAFGEVKNTAGLLELSATLTVPLQLVCDRCGQRFAQEKSIAVQNLVADHLEQEEAWENEDILLLDGDELDLDEVFTTAFILDMDSKLLCRPDCKGLCAGCGANLNHSSCRCKRAVDPRLAALAALLEE